MLLIKFATDYDSVAFLIFYLSHSGSAFCFFGFIFTLLYNVRIILTNNRFCGILLKYG